MALGTVLIFVLAILTPHVNSGFWGRSASLLCAIAAARSASRIMSPLGAILFKWLVIGRYRAGQYRMYVRVFVLFFQLGSEILS
jgi:hypothetical protein